MNGLVFLLYCIEILAPLSCGAQSVPGPNTTEFWNGHSPSTFTASATPSVVDPTSVPITMSVANSQPPTTVSRDSSTRSASPTPGRQPTTTPIGMFQRKECLPVFMVAGGLIIACTILLVSTLLLIWKVCQLSRRIKMLSSNSDLISTSEYWIGTAKKNKSTPETGAKETTVLMTDICQTQEEMGNGTAKEEVEEVNEEGQTGEENEKEVGDTAKSEEEASTPPVAENASTSKPQEEATDSQSTKASAATSSEATEEPKDVV